MPGLTPGMVTLLAKGGSYYENFAKRYCRTEKELFSHAGHTSPGGLGCGVSGHAPVLHCCTVCDRVRGHHSDCHDVRVDVSAYAILMHRVLLLTLF